MTDCDCCKVLKLPVDRAVQCATGVEGGSCGGGPLGQVRRRLVLPPAPGHQRSAAPAAQPATTEQPVLAASPAPAAPAAPDIPARQAPDRSPTAGASRRAPAPDHWAGGDGAAAGHGAGDHGAGDHGTGDHGMALWADLSRELRAAPILQPAPPLPPSPQRSLEGESPERSAAQLYPQSNTSGPLARTGVTPSGTSSVAFPWSNWRQFDGRSLAHCESSIGLSFARRQR